MVPGHEVKVERHEVLHKTKVLQILHIPLLEEGLLCKTAREKDMGKREEDKKENEKRRNAKMERMK